MNPNRSDLWEITFTVCIPILVVVGVICLIMAAPSIDAIVFGR